MRLTPTEVATIDAHRGGLTRSAYVRSLIRGAQKPEAQPKEQPVKAEPPAEALMRCPHRMYSVCDDCAKGKR